MFGPPCSAREPHESDTSCRTPSPPKFSNVSQSPTSLPPSRALAQSIDLIHDASLPNAPSSRPITQDTIERPLVTSYHALTQATIKYCYPLPRIASQFSIGAMCKQGGHPVTYHSETLSTTKFNYCHYAK
jgi:hypothetical protein